MPRAKPTAKPLLGWREWVVLPSITPVAIKAKIDTGARTSALHAFDLSVTTVDGQPWAEFEVHPVQRSRASAARVVTPIVGYRKVKSSTGHSEERPVINTTVLVAGRELDIELTLTSRDAMGFRMLLGRSAIRRRFWVDAGRSYLHPIPTINTAPDRNEP